MRDQGSTPAAENPLIALTIKQRQVLDLLIEHKTSKEISRLLGISPHTVDQRINHARAKLGASSRGQVASEYRRLIGIYEESIYQFSYMASNAYLDDCLTQSDTVEPEISTSPEKLIGQETAKDVLNYRVGPELFEGRWGTLARLGAIVALALLMVVSVLGGISIFLTVSRLIGS